MNIVEQMKSDEGVSPVIAVILMVAITVVLAATVYVWVSGFASDQDGPEQASATAKGIDLDDNGDVEWVQLSLTSGANAPYSDDDVTVSVTDNNGADVSNVCESAEYDSTNDVCSTPFSSSTWDVGENLWVPCQGDGNHIITVSLKGTAILDSTLDCDQDATA